jgi:hypothetical protein
MMEMTSQLTLDSIWGNLLELFRDSWISDIVKAIKIASTG